MELIVLILVVLSAETETAKLLVVINIEISPVKIDVRHSKLCIGFVETIEINERKVKIVTLAHL